MSDDVQYVAHWSDPATQCKNCKNFQAKEGKNVCVPEDETFEEALKVYGEVNLEGHCNYFEEK